MLCKVLPQGLCICCAVWNALSQMFPCWLLIFQVLTKQHLFRGLPWPPLPKQWLPSRYFLHSTSLYLMLHYVHNSVHVRSGMSAPRVRTLSVLSPAVAPAPVRHGTGVQKYLMISAHTHSKCISWHLHPCPQK